MEKERVEREMAEKERQRLEKEATDERKREEQRIRDIADAESRTKAEVKLKAKEDARIL
jgi:hypothetical protein